MSSHPYWLTLTVAERAAILDALEKGASRHESFARFNPMGRTVKKHEDLAVIMRRLYRQIAQTGREAA